MPYAVWVLENNYPARKFYEKHGGVIVDVKQITISNENYKEVCYKFDN